MLILIASWSHTHAHQSANESSSRMTTSPCCKASSPAFLLVVLCFALYLAFLPIPGSTQQPGNPGSLQHWLLIGPGESYWYHILLGAQRDHLLCWIRRGSVGHYLCHWEFYPILYTHSIWAVVHRLERTLNTVRDVLTRIWEPAPSYWLAWDAASFQCVTEHID